MYLSCDLFLCLIIYLTVVKYCEVNGLAFDDLDFVRSTIEDATKSITSTPVTISAKFPKVTIAIRGPDIYPTRKISIPDLMRLIESRPMKFGNRPAENPRNLNKFNEAMDQVERAMTQAELSRKTVRLTDLRKDIINAVNRGNVR